MICCMENVPLKPKYWIKNVNIVNPTPVIAPNSNPFPFPFNPAIKPPTNNEIIPKEKVTYVNVNSDMVVNRMMSEVKSANNKTRTNIAIQP